MRPANFIHKAALFGAIALALIYGKAQTTAAQPSGIHNMPTHILLTYGCLSLFVRVLAEQLGALDRSLPHVSVDHFDAFE
jgi:hypothetical protein